MHTSLFSTSTKNERLIWKATPSKQKEANFYVLWVMGKMTWNVLPIDIEIRSADCNFVLKNNTSQMQCRSLIVCPQENQGQKSRQCICTLFLQNPTHFHPCFCITSSVGNFFIYWKGGEALLIDFLVVWDETWDWFGCQSSYQPLKLMYLSPNRTTNKCLGKK